MKDLVFKLRAPAFCFEEGKPPRLATEQTMLDMSAAADAIEQLHAALNTICGVTLGSAPCDGAGKIHKIAVAALSAAQGTKS